MLKYFNINFWQYKNLAVFVMIFINLFNSFNSSLIGPLITTVLNNTFPHPSNLIKLYSSDLINNSFLLLFNLFFIVLTLNWAHDPNTTCFPIKSGEGTTKLFTHLAILFNFLMLHFVIREIFILSVAKKS